MGSGDGASRNLGRGPNFQLERLDPEDADPGNLSFSLKRYQFARSLVARKVVLDAGCGTGYGCSLLADDASFVVGVDYDADVLGHARRKYPAGNLDFVATTITELPFDAATFDVVVNFEVIEHLPDHEAHLVLFSEVRRVLKADGLFVISTSNRSVTVPHQKSVGITVDAHLTEMDLKTFRSELEREFAVEFFGGMRYDGNKTYRVLRSLDIRNLRLMLPPKFREFIAQSLFGVNRRIRTGANVIIEPSQLHQAAHFLAICRNRVAV